MLKERLQSGQSTIILVLFIAFLVLLSAGLFSFELNRVEVARQQLRTATEAAALAGAATLASSNVTNPTTAQTTAMDTALTQFQQNSIIGVSLANAVFTYSSPDTPGANDSALYVQFLNPNANNAPVALGNPNGKTVQVTSFFGLQPAFGKFLGINTVTLQVTALGGVPQMDIVLCFDVSASIDDETNVTFVRRQWNSGSKVINYIVAATTSGAPVGSLAEGSIYNCIVPDPTGTAVDGLPPQSLQAANEGVSYNLDFSESTSAAGLRGTLNGPPGNYTNASQNMGSAQTFTDVVVNLDGNAVFGGFTSPAGYAYPNLATLVEASRGNLENATVFASSKANVSVPSTVLPRAGYQADYIANAKLNLHPLYDAQMASQTFLNIMNTDCDSHFSLVAFTTNAGTSATNTDNMPNVDSSYPAAGNGNFPVPLIALNATTGANNYTTCYNMLPTLTAVSATNIGDVLNTAVQQLKTNARPGAHKAIILFTDGEPTQGGPLSSNVTTNARMAASEANAAGIPIYSIGLAQNPAIIPGETAILNATDSNPSTGGVSGIAGYGGQFFLVTNNADLQLTFENIARQLVQLVR